MPTYHQDVLITYSSLGRRIGITLDQAGHLQLDRNEAILRAIVDTVLLCVRQSIALCGRRDDNTADLSSNRGNSVVILEHSAKGNPILKEYLENGKSNQRYASKTIQTKIISFIGSTIKMCFPNYLIPNMLAS